MFHIKSNIYYLSKTFYLFYFKATVPFLPENKFKFEKHTTDLHSAYHTLWGPPERREFSSRTSCTSCLPPLRPWPLALLRWCMCTYTHWRHGVSEATRTNRRLTSWSSLSLNVSLKEHNGANVRPGHRRGLSQFAESERQPPPMPG